MRKVVMAPPQKRKARNKNCKQLSRTYRTGSSGDNAIERESLGDASAHAACARRLDGLIDGVLLAADGI